MEQTSATAAASAGIARRLDLIITGQDSAGRHFTEPAHTELLTRDGGVIVCFVPVQVTTLVSLQMQDRRAEARVLGVMRIRDEEHTYAFELVNATGPAFWQVEFPKRATPPATALQCSRCATQKSLHLGEIHQVVLDTSRVVVLECQKCREYTLWHAPIVLEDVELVTGADAYQQTGAMAPHRSRTANDRRHKRLQIKNTRACLKRVGFKDDVVDVLDLSRGGIRFLSLVDYQPDTRVEVAAPYTEGGANVFTPARVARVKSRATVDIPGEFALEYLKRG